MAPESSKEQRDENLSTTTRVATQNPILRQPDESPAPALESYLKTLEQVLSPEVLLGLSNLEWSTEMPEPNSSAEVERTVTDDSQPAPASNLHGTTTCAVPGCTAAPFSTQHLLDSHAKVMHFGS
jgi:hypothetical protein